MAIVPTMGSTQGSLIKGEAGLSISVAATILNVVVEEDETGQEAQRLMGPILMCRGGCTYSTIFG